MKVNHKLDGCNVRLTDNMAQLAPPIGARPFMIFGWGPCCPAFSSSEGGPGAGCRVGAKGLVIAHQGLECIALVVEVGLPPAPEFCLPHSCRADVTHPMGGEDMPSIAAVVG